VFDFENAEVVPCLPAVFASQQGEPFPPELTGAQIVFIGTLADTERWGTGLVIDYRTASERGVRRVVFGFDDTVMRVVYQGVSRSRPTSALLPESAV
jgi:hypothetical protein